MARELPAGLSDAQRIVLSEFFAGRISAGQLTQRLGIEVVDVAHRSLSEPAPRTDPKVPRQRTVRIPNPLRWAGQ
jgi:hypothetical protein